MHTIDPTTAIRIIGYTDNGTIHGWITATGGRYNDIHHVIWDDGDETGIGNHDLGITWDYDPTDNY